MTALDPSIIPCRVVVASRKKLHLQIQRQETLGSVELFQWGSSTALRTPIESSLPPLGSSSILSSLCSLPPRLSSTTLISSGSSPECVKPKKTKAVVAKGAIFERKRKTHEISRYSDVIFHLSTTLSLILSPVAASESISESRR